MCDWFDGVGFVIDVNGDIAPVDVQICESYVTPQQLFEFLKSEWEEDEQQSKIPIS